MSSEVTKDRHRLHKDALVAQGVCTWCRGQRDRAGRHCSGCLLKQRAASKASNRRLRTELLTAYGGVCKCCGEDTPEFLALDHISGGGGAERRSGLTAQKLHRQLRDAGWPQENHRLLCHNCNMARGLYGRCPHEGE